MKIDLLKKNIPKGWQKLYLGDIANITNGKTNSQDAVDDGVYPLFDRSVLIKKSNKFLFDAEAIILPGEGAEFIPRYFNGKFDLHQRAYAILGNKEKIFSPFLYQYLFAKRDIFRKTAVGSTVKSLRLPIIKKVSVNVPPISEQKRIAEILSAVDEEIKKTEELIFETEKLKSSLMSDLFTKGIGHKKFKKTKIGSIPEEWNLLSIKESSVSIIDGDRGINYPKTTDFFTEGYCLFLSTKNIKDDQFVFRESQFISKEKDEFLRKGKLQRNDVVLTTRGTVGNVAFYDDSVPFENIRINSGMVLIRSSKDFIPEYLYHLFKSPLFKKRYFELASGSAQPQLPIRSLENILVPIPSVNEQKKIVEISKSLDQKIYINNLLRVKLVGLKQGLMLDLLSGKVRTIKI
jgi:type I restriction enzyme S subunit